MAADSRGAVECECLRVVAEQAMLGLERAGQVDLAAASGIDRELSGDIAYLFRGRQRWTLVPLPTSLSIVTCPPDWRAKP